MTTSSDETVKRWTPSDDIAGSMTDEYQTGPYVASRDHDAIVSALRLRLSDQATYGAKQLGKLRAQVNALETERDARSAVVSALEDVERMRADAHNALLAAVTIANARYQWCANELLACDYGDNDAPGKQIGWRVYGWRDRSGERRIYGASIDIAVDAALSPPSPLPKLKGSDGRARRHVRSTNRIRESGEGHERDHNAAGERCRRDCAQADVQLSSP